MFGGHVFRQNIFIEHLRVIKRQILECQSWSGKVRLNQRRGCPENARKVATTVMCKAARGHRDVNTCSRVALRKLGVELSAPRHPTACETTPPRVVTSSMAPDVASMTSTPTTPALKNSQKPPSGSNILEVVLGSLLIKPWYPSFYPEELVGRRVERLYVCQWCFKYSKELVGFLGHLVRSEYMKKEDRLY